MTKVLIGNLRGPTGATGLQGEAGVSGVVPKKVTLTNSATLDGTETLVFVDGQNLVITLADATQSPNDVTIKLTSPFTMATIVLQNGQVIDGGFVSYPLETEGQWVTYSSDGANYQVIGAKSGGQLTVPFTNLPDGVIDEPYSIKLTASGGWPGYTWVVKAGTLPQGMTLTPEGVISGTTTVSGTTSFTIQVTDSVGMQFPVQVSITAVAPSSGAGVTLANRGPVNSQFTNSITLQYGGDTQEHNFVLAHIGCNGSGPVATEDEGWVVIGGDTGGPALAYKMDCDAAETAPTFTGGSATDMNGYLEEWIGIVTEDALDRFVLSLTDDGQSWDAIFPSFDTQPDELIVGAGYWNGSNVGGDVAVSVFKDSLGGTIDANLVQNGNQFGQYFAGVAGILGETGSNANELSMNLSVFAAGRGIMATFKAANVGPAGDPSIVTSSPLRTGATLKPYKVVLGAQDGAPPYVWSLAEDSPALQAGLSLSTDGVISGTPTSSGTVAAVIQVADTFSQIGTATLDVPITLTPTPTFTTSLAMGTSQGYTSDDIVGAQLPVPVNNNVWSPVAGWQSFLSVVDASNFWVKANFPVGNTKVSSYPSLGCYFLEKPLSDFTKLVYTFDETINGTSGTQAWAASDNWLNNWANEVMVQNDLSRFNTWVNTPLERNISFGGENGVEVLSWELHEYGTSEFVWCPANNSWNREIGSIDLLQMLQWMIDHGYLPADSTMTAVGYGWEICSTGGIDEVFELNGFTLDAEYSS